MKLKLLSVATVAVILAGCVSNANHPTVSRCSNKAQVWVKSDIKSTKRLVGNMYNGAVDIVK